MNEAVFGRRQSYAKNNESWTRAPNTFATSAARYIRALAELGS